MSTMQPAANGAPQTWYVLWCQERCHKSENEARRELLTMAAAQIGAEILLFKKAKQFHFWLDRCPGERYVLITDWREAQPCMEVLAHKLAEKSVSGVPSAMPEMTVVLCESERQGSRATEWARTLGEDFGSVHAFKRDSVPSSLLYGLVKQVFSEPCVTDRSGNFDSSSFSGEYSQESSSFEPVRPYTSREGSSTNSFGSHHASSGSRQQQQQVGSPSAPSDPPWPRFSHQSRLQKFLKRNEDSNNSSSNRQHSGAELIPRLPGDTLGRTMVQGDVYKQLPSDFMLRMHLPPGLTSLDHPAQSDSSSRVQPIVVTRISL
mmetsp:Transcript_99522/g.179632  ORF Transcript_99522/g.179632 Transcript_99522/m.179632 type:complete len:319 (+) Transcript_99522:84-1040(+)